MERSDKRTSKPVNYWELRDQVTAEEVAKLPMSEIRENASRLEEGESYLHDIPVESFYDPKGTPPERKGVLVGLVKAVQEEVDQIAKNRFSVSGGTLWGIERGVIRVRRDN